MKTISGQSLGIEQGNLVLFTDFEDGGEMWTGQGPRQKRNHVAFTRPFITDPAVQVGLALWDMDSANNIRADISTDNITASGFDVVFKTWGDTRVARMRVNWLAIGAVENEDDWELY